MLVPSPLMIRLLIAGLLCAVPQAAFGRFVPYRQSYAMFSRDGRHMLVMPALGDYCALDGDVVALPTGQVVNLREDYPAAGLYKTGSFEPIWTVDWFSREGYVCASHDFQYLVRVREWERREASWSVKCYEDGVEARSYTFKQLVDFPSCSMLPLRSWERYGPMAFGFPDEVYISGTRWGAAEVGAANGNIYRIHIASGEVLGVWRHYGRVFLLWAGLFILPGIVAWAGAGLGRARKTAPSPNRAAVCLLPGAYVAGNLILLAAFWEFDITFPTALLAWLVAQASLIATWTTRSRARRFARFLLAGAALAWTWWLTTFVAAREDLGQAGSVALALMFLAQFAVIVAAVAVPRWVSRPKARSIWRLWRVQFSLRFVLFGVALAAVLLGLWRYVFVHLGWRPDASERICLIRAPVLGACNAACALVVLASLHGRRWLLLRLALAAAANGLLGCVAPHLLRFVADFGKEEELLLLFSGVRSPAITLADSLTLAGLQAAFLGAALLPLCPGRNRASDEGAVPAPSTG